MREVGIHTHFTNEESLESLSDSPKVIQPVGGGTGGKPTAGRGSVSPSLSCRVTGVW